MSDENKAYSDMMVRFVGDELLSTYKWVVGLNNFNAPITRKILHDYMEAITNANETLRKSLGGE